MKDSRSGKHCFYDHVRVHTDSQTPAVNTADPYTDGEEQYTHCMHTPTHRGPQVGPCEHQQGIVQWWFRRRSFATRSKLVGKCGNKGCLAAALPEELCPTAP